MIIENSKLGYLHDKKRRKDLARNINSSAKTSQVRDPEIRLQKSEVPNPFCLNRSYNPEGIVSLRGQALQTEFGLPKLGSPATATSFLSP